MIFYFAFTKYNPWFCFVAARKWKNAHTHTHTHTGPFWKKKQYGYVIAILPTKKTLSNQNFSTKNCLVKRLDAVSWLKNSTLKKNCHKMPSFECHPFRQAYFACFVSPILLRSWFIFLQHFRLVSIQIDPNKFLFKKITRTEKMICFSPQSFLFLKKILQFLSRRNREWIPK